MKKILTVLSVVLLTGLLFSCKGLLGGVNTDKADGSAGKNPLAGTQWKDEIAASYNFKDGNVLEFVYNKDIVVNGTWSYTEPDFQYTIGNSSKKGQVEFTTDNKKMVLIENPGSLAQTAMVFSKIEQEPGTGEPEPAPAEPHAFAGEIWKDNQGNIFTFELGEVPPNKLKYELKYSSGDNGTWSLAENELTMEFGGSKVKGIVEFTNNIMILTHSEGADMGKIEVYINLKKAPAPVSPEGDTAGGGSDPSLPTP